MVWGLGLGLGFFFFCLFVFYFVRQWFRDFIGGWLRFWKPRIGQSQLCICK